MFEFDDNKSQSNLEKHGIDFVAAQELWENGVVEFVVSEEPEERFFHVGKIKDKFWTAVITYRGENIRIISVRRSREKEIAKYEAFK